MAKKKSFTNGHKAFTVPENRFLSTIYEREEKQRRCHGEKRFLKERNPLVAEPTARLSEFAQFLSSKESSRRKDQNGFPDIRKPSKKKTHRLSDGADVIEKLRNTLVL